MSARLFGCAGSIAALALACAPIQRNLNQAKVETIKSKPRAVAILDVEVKDVRDRRDFKQLRPKVRYFVPLVVFNFWGTAGHVRPKASLVSRQPAAELDQIITAALDTANLIATNPDDAESRLTLRIELTELYGLTYQSGDSFVAMGGAAFSERSFAPYGFAAARMELVAEDGAVMATRRVTGSYDPDHSDFKRSRGHSGDGLDDRLTWAAVQAAGDLTTNIVRAVEPLLAEWPVPDSSTSTLDRAFYIVRPTPDGQYMELGLIDLRTGDVIDSRVKRRWMEPFSSIQEWVVDPYQGGERMLSREEYQHLIGRIENRFDVRYATNVSVAHFFGLRQAAGSGQTVDSGRSEDSGQTVDSGRAVDSGQTADSGRAVDSRRKTGRKVGSRKNVGPRKPRKAKQRRHAKRRR